MAGTFALTSTRPISLTSVTEAIATMFYLNDALINVDAGIFGILSSKKILDAYGLSFDFDVMSTWVSGTPEAISGEGRLLSQVGIIPAKTDCANLGGNHASAGRRNVAGSRGRIVNSFHMASECFDAKGIPAAWKEHLNFFHKYRDDPNVLVEYIDVESDGNNMAPIAYLLCPSLQEESAFSVLLGHLKDLPTFVSDVMVANETFKERYHRGPRNVVYEKMLVVADGLVDEIVEGSRGIDVIEYEKTLIDDDSSNDDGDATSSAETDEEEEKEDATSSAESDEEDGGEDATTPAESCAPGVKGYWTTVTYRTNFIDAGSFLSLLPHLLRAVSFLFTASHAQVVPTVIHRTVEMDWTVVNEIITLQRFLALIALSMYDGCSTTMQHVPHKLYFRQGRAVRECRSTRFALEVMEGEKKVMYAYLGGGVTWDPPFAYSLVYKGMPLHIAERLLAVILYFARGHVDSEMIAVKPVSNPKNKLTAEAKEERVKDVVLNVSSHLSWLRTTFSSRDSLFKEYLQGYILCPVCEGSCVMSEEPYPLCMCEPW